MTTPANAQKAQKLRKLSPYGQRLAAALAPRLSAALVAADVPPAVVVHVLSHVVDSRATRADFERESKRFKRLARAESFSARVGLLASDLFFSSKTKPTKFTGVKLQPIDLEMATEYEASFTPPSSPIEAEPATESVYVIEEGSGSYVEEQPSGGLLSFQATESEPSVYVEESPGGYVEESGPGVYVEEGPGGYIEESGPGVYVEELGGGPGVYVEENPGGEEGGPGVYIEEVGGGPDDFWGSDSIIGPPEGGFTDDGASPPPPPPPDGGLGTEGFTDDSMGAPPGGTVDTGLDAPPGFGSYGNPYDAPVPPEFQTMLLCGCNTRGLGNFPGSYCGPTGDFYSERVAAIVSGSVGSAAGMPKRSCSQCNKRLREPLSRHALLRVSAILSQMAAAAPSAPAGAR